MLAAIRSRIEQVQPEDVLISAESFSVHGPQVAGPLFAALAGHPLRILVWLRRQDRYAEAVYKQTVKWNGASSNPDAVLRRIALQLNYEQLLVKWQEAYPQAEIILRIYEEAAPGPVPDSIADMLAVMGRARLVPQESAGHRRTGHALHWDSARRCPRPATREPEADE
ncbi:hypothetical protein [Paracoccus sp. PAR01]|uniref:hypothetical protein n=1 Tax=Paracoccus sp. PAR01 TaxID=2769282 RepID=UPI00177BF3E9|nr:hypothetical protein [Paracoccus sp. PAR01]MBD9526432.1 hypothetical protein [Paracoccus sp. PAR01]